MNFFRICMFILLLAFSLNGECDFRLIDEWHPGDEVVGKTSLSLINEDGHVVAVFYMCGNRLITPKKIIKFAPRGQGPGDLTDMMALFLHNKDIAYVERPEKIKIFKKEYDTYKIKEIVWIKRGYSFHIIQNGLFCNGKYFLAGFEILEFDKKNEIQHVSFLKIYDEKGTPLKNLIKKKFHGFSRAYEMDYYVVNCRDSVYFLIENELKVHKILLKNLEVEKVVALEVPKFYKKMPEDFYVPKTLAISKKKMAGEVEYWKTSYSRINKVIVENDYLILQMRTCDEKLKKFGLLFYNASNFKLEKTIFIDDLLLGSRDGKYYFFAGGNPGIDDEADEFIIKVYSMEKENEKE